MNPVQFKNPPIKEAIIDIKIKPLDRGYLKKIENIGELIKSYPIRKNLFSSSLKFKISKTGDPKVEKSTSDNLGYRFETKTGNYVAQFKLDGFTFSILNSYKSWENFIKTAKELWDKYLKIVEPQLVTRVSCRFINRILIPDKKYINEYFTFEDDDKDIDGFISERFLNRTQLFNKEKGIKLLLTKMDESITHNGEHPIIIDNDVLKTVQLDPKSKEIWEIINSFRIIKNDIFFNCITQKTRKLFN